jgi:glucose-6-phosphate 1-dehydrogenase
MRADQVEAAWRVVTPILEAWKKETSVRFPNYAPGSWGPKSAETLIEKDGRCWTLLPENGIIKNRMKKKK